MPNRGIRVLDGDDWSIVVAPQGASLQLVVSTEGSEASSVLLSPPQSEELRKALLEVEERVGPRSADPSWAGDRVRVDL